MSNNVGQPGAISKHAVTQALIMIHGYMQGIQILLLNRSIKQESPNKGLNADLYVACDQCKHWRKGNREKGRCARERERERGSALENESERWREELSSVAAQGGLAFTNPFFFDLFIQMKEQQQAGLCGTIALSPPNPDLIGFYKSPNHFQLSTFSDIL